MGNALYLGDVYSFSHSNTLKVDVFETFDVWTFGLKQTEPLLTAYEQKNLNWLEHFNPLTTKW